VDRLLYQPFWCPFSAILKSIMITWVALVVIVILSGALGDVVGRRKLMGVSLLLAATAIFPLLGLLHFTQYPSRMWPLKVFHFLLFGLLYGL